MRFGVFLGLLVLAVTGGTCQQAATKGSPATSEKNPPLFSTPPAQPLAYRPFSISDFTLELSLASAFIIYLMVFYQGSRKNKDLARTWLRSTLGIWTLQFAQLGDGQGHKLIKDGPRDYVLYATGRKYVSHVYGFLHVRDISSLGGSCCSSYNVKCIVGCSS